MPAAFSNTHLHPVPEKLQVSTIILEVFSLPCRKTNKLFGVAAAVFTSANLKLKLLVVAVFEGERLTAFEPRTFTPGLIQAVTKKGARRVRARSLNRRA